MLPSCCCGECAVHTFLQQPASFRVVYVWRFHVRPRLPACIDRMSASAPAERLEAPPVFADSCGGSSRPGVHVSSHLFRFHLARQPTIGAFDSPDQIVFETFRVCSFSIHEVVLARHFSVCGCPITKQPLQPNVAPNSDTILFVMLMRLTISSFLVFVTVRPPLLGSPSECIWPALRGWGRLPRVRLASSTDSKYSQQRITIPPPFFVSPSNAAARHHCCTVAHDVFTCSRVEAEPATVQPVHSEFTMWSRGLVWLE